MLFLQGGGFLALRLTPGLEDQTTPTNENQCGVIVTKKQENVEQENTMN